MDRTRSEHVREQTEQWSQQQRRRGGDEPARERFDRWIPASGPAHAGMNRMRVVAFRHLGGGPARAGMNPCA